MRWLLLLAALALTACQPPAPQVIYIEVPADPEPAPPEEPPAEPEPPAWAPEPWHIYVFDDADAVLVEEEARPEAEYRSRYTAWGYTVEMHNILDDPAHPWRLVGGGTQ